LPTHSAQPLHSNHRGPRPSSLFPKARRTDRILLKANASGDSGADSSLSLEEARQVLGIPENATFEQTVQAKNKLLSKVGADDEKQIQIETAYDALLMKSMKARLSGELKPARDVRFADVQKYRPAQPREKSWQEKVGEKLPGGVKVEKSARFGPGPNLVFGSLAASALIQEVALSSPDTSNIPALQLGLAFGASIYYLRDLKKLSLVKAGGLTTAGLIVGTLFGSLLQNFLRVDIVPIGGVHSPSTLVAEFSILSMWLTAFFLA